MKQNKTNQQEILKSEFIQEFASDLVAGLSNPRKFVPSKYFYDKNGSELFEQISSLPEYYLTRTETAILQAKSLQIASILNASNQDDRGISIIELGSGSSAKTRILLNQFLALNNKVHYFPIDLSHDMLQQTTKQLESQFPNIDVTGIPTDYDSGIEEANRIINQNATIPKTKLIVFLGSSIGNFEREQSISFLRMLRAKMTSDQDFLLVGFDLQCKSPKVLSRAYNDSQGITAKFNLNLLARINRELGGNFDIDKFSHLAFYNKKHRRIEMHLVSRTDQDVCVNATGRQFSFRKGETIHTENSYKYSIRQVQSIARLGGFKLQHSFTDSKKRFMLALMSPLG